MAVIMNIKPSSNAETSESESSNKQSSIEGERRDALPSMPGGEVEDGRSVAASEATLKGGLPTPIPADALLKKVRSNAAWNALSPEQREKLEDWLFEDNLSYQTAWLRAKKLFGYTGSKSSIRRFHDRASQERTLSSLMTTREQVAAIQSAPVDVAQLCDAGMKVAAQMFLQQVTTQPEQTKQWGFFAKIVLRHQAVEARNAVKREENAIRQGQLALAREKWNDELDQRARAEYAEALDKEINELQLAKNPISGKYVYNQRANRIRFGLFGRNLDFNDMLPESYEEEQAMNAVKELPPQTSKKERQKIARKIYRNARKRQAQLVRERAEEFERLRNIAEESLRKADEQKKAEIARREQEKAEAAAREKAEAETRRQQEPSKPEWQDKPNPRPPQSRFLVPLIRLPPPP
jgi:hypothetical protein